MKPRILCVAIVLIPCMLATASAASNDKAEAKKAETAADSVVAVFSLDGPIVETPLSEDRFLGRKDAESLKDLLGRMKKAAEDKDVKACALLLGHAEFNLAQAEEIRGAIERIKAAGKKVYAHADSLSMGRYALLVGASRLCVVPTGDIWVMGLHAESPYLRGLLDMIGVTPDFLTCGAYKSAAEILMRKGPSPEAQQMRSWLLDSLYESYVGMIAQGRGVSSEQVRKWIDAGPYSAEEAKKLGMIDDVQFQQDFLSGLKSKCGEAAKLDKKYAKKGREELDLSSPFAVFKLWVDMLQGPKKPGEGKSAVAIVYVDGPILPGKREETPFPAEERIAYSTPVSKALDKVAQDDSVKAVVLRVDSPGGSAVASEIILNATKRVKAKKPLVVSMGGMAGSGGYYVACGGGTIFADATTITGSIGVVGGKLATTPMWNKVGINWDSSKRGANADMLSSEAVFTPDQRKKLQGWMDEVYAVFKQHVVEGRGERLKKNIDELSGGRVYTGRQALELGLVDRLGGLDDAIAFSAKEAKITEYEVRVVPRPKSFLEILLQDLTDDEDDENGSADAGVFTWLELLAPRGSTSILQTALPYLKHIEPHRLEAVRTALLRLGMLQREQALMMMPEIYLSD